MSMLTDILGPFGFVIIAGGLGLVLIAVAAGMFLLQPADPLKKLQAASAATSTTGRENRLRADSGTDKLEKFSHFLEPQDEEEFSSIRLKLIQAGYRSRNAVRWYFFAQMVLGLGALGLGLLYAFMASAQETLQPKEMVMYALLPAVVGYMAPRYWVNKRQEERQKSILEGFPDALDMMLVCVEAGQSMDQSIIRVARESRDGYPALSEEFEIVAHEMKAGKDKAVVLRDLSERAGVPDISSFVTVLIQSATFGTPITDALRVYAEEMRDKRVMRAEEKANTLPTKMTLATMGLTVPPLILILIGPSIYGIVEMFEKMK
ncbi:type II secretion system F family protein [Donghicola eburneus]|jgi:tight adherence protein C|uniref:Pilus assembly protein TadC n=1 Tax=Donghicola eburneus TaxID=393278 RepID=A0A1M4MX50_9RHOB|nr:type II secretion system F family protein [Donghicola eburneus]SCM67090.1 pilus assembly protein TadC [Donghicola eburneus]SFQ72108.1 tight adherence protein C [Donghicola eburneus]